MDPMGLGYENFDATGRLHAGADTSGAILEAPGLEGTFMGSADLHEKLASSAEVQSCFVKLWTRYAFGITDSPDGQPTLTSLTQAFRESDTRIDALVLGLTQTDHFRKRDADPEEQPATDIPANTTGGTSGGSSGPMTPPPMKAGPSTPGIVFEPQPGYENGKEEGSGNWWVRGTLRNTTGMRLSGWVFRMKSPGTFKMSSTIKVIDEGDEWALQGLGDKENLEPMRGYYIDMQLSKN
jgi:hypothetical protein